MSSALAEATDRTIKKKEYRVPKLVAYGGLRELTQNGSGATKENNGKAICGTSFQKSGGSSC